MQLDNLEQLAVHYMNIFKYDKALEVIKKLLYYEPENGYYLYLQGKCLTRNGYYDEGIEVIKTAITAGYRQEECYQFLGFIYYDLNDYKNAYPYFQEVLRINPENAQVLVVYGSLKYRNKFNKHNKRDAERLINAALAIEPNAEFILRIAFFFYRDSRNKESMEKTLKSYVHVSSDEVMKFQMRGELAYEKCNFYKAEKYFREAFCLNPTDRYLQERLKDLNRKFKPILYYKKWKKDYLSFVGDIPNEFLRDMLIILGEAAVYGALVLFLMAEVIFLLILKVIIFGA